MNNKILIVDDTKSWQVFHQKLIEQLYGDIFEISFASSAKEALNIIKANRTNPFAVIITDLQMEMDFGELPAGEWLVENIKILYEYAASKIVIISSMYNIEMIAKKHNVECISKNMLVSNKLLMKYMFEKIMPFLVQVEEHLK